MNSTDERYHPSTSQFKGAAANAAHPAPLAPQFRGLSIEYLGIDSIRPNPRNARTHSKKQIKLIADSIRTFGFNSPVIVDGENVVIAGHGRVEAAKLLGYSTVPTVRIEHLTPDQIRAYALADNQLALRAGWDKSVLSVELEYLVTLAGDMDVSITGFDTGEIDQLILGDSADLKPDPDDRLPETSGIAVSQPGDLWLLNDHRVLCGDATSALSHEALMGEHTADVVVSDFPYNCRIPGHVSGLGAIKHRDFVMASGEMSREEFTEFLGKVMRNLTRHTRHGSLHYIFIDWRHIGELLDASKDVYKSFINLCVWVKDNPGMGSFYRSQHELIFVFRNGNAQHQNNVELGKFGRNRTNVWTAPSVNAFARQTDEGRLADLHPTVKPVALIADAILDCTSRGQIVLDPFLGSGTAIIAAERVGRRCYGMELDPLYVDTAIRRWQRYSGSVAIHAISGARFDEVESKTETHHG